MAWAIVTSSLAVVSACGASGSGTAANDAGPPPADASNEGEPQHLSETGLYSDITSKTVSASVLEYAVQYALWADSADKTRWILLPAGAHIDTSDMDHWQFPIGTKFFKEFALNGKMLETRMVEHVSNTGKDEVDYRLSGFVWRDDESDADLATKGAPDVRGTDHDLPTRDECFKCHRGEAGKVLGFSAIQLSHPNSSVTLQWLADQGKLTAPPAQGADFSPPGTPAVANALGYMHANCGHCHNENGTAWPDNPMVLRLSVSERTPESTALYAATIGVPMQRAKTSGDTDRVVAGHTEQSGLLYRMTLRDAAHEGMPPIASKKVDDNGKSIVATWIQGL